MTEPQPDVASGITYWTSQPASYDGVLGGYGTGTLPRVDSLGSRLFLLSILPELSTILPAVTIPTPPSSTDRRPYKALEVGAGVGRVTSDVLLYHFHTVYMIEPVEPFINTAIANARSGKWASLTEGKTVHFIQATLQSFDLSKPLASVGEEVVEEGVKFDVAWCQWCLGHLSTPDLIVFFKRLATLSPLIVVKENVCSDSPEGEPREVYDAEDSSLTRSDEAWKKAFKDAGLTLFKEEVQEGLPEGLYVVKRCVYVDIQRTDFMLTRNTVTLFNLECALVSGPPLQPPVRLRSAQTV